MNQTMESEQMKEDEKKRSRFGTLVEIWRFRIIVGCILAVPAIFLDNLLQLVVNSSGTAITTANLSQLLNWRTPLILILGLLLIFCYIILEIFAQIYLSHDILSGEDSHVFREVAMGFRAVKRFLSPKGFLIVLYITVAVPLCGIGFSISLTDSFYLPNFITSVIYSTPIYLIGYLAGLAGLIFFGYRSVFTLHAILLDNMNAAKGQKMSFQIMKEHGREVLKKLLIVGAYSLLILIASNLLTQLVPELIVGHMGEGLESGYQVDIIAAGSASALSTEQMLVLEYRVKGAILLLIGFYVNAVITMLVSSNIIIQLTKLYYRYTDRQVQLNRSRSRRRFLFLTVGFVGLPALLIVVAVFAGLFFNQIENFFHEQDPGLVAHRTGGILASENSLEGIDESVKLGVYGSETDIQRTKDGAYVINHDNSFKRLTGVAKKPGEMTLAEIKQLRIRDTTGSGELLEVPTMEEVLDRAKGRITLFLELKGPSADRKMADDIVAAVRERDMTDGVVLISLNYKVIDYIERTYPEFETGVLIFAGLGDVSSLNCDMIIMEEEMSTVWVIDKLHSVGKKAAVWTVNTEEAMRHFLNSSADCIITDEIPMAIEVEKELENRTDMEVMEDWMGNL